MPWTPGPGPTNGNDTFVGTSGDDDVQGLGGNDQLSGGLGNDTLRDVTGGNDTLLGEAGDDFLLVERGVFTPVGLSTILMNGGDGNDRLSLFGTSATNKPITATLIGGEGDDTIYILGGATNANVDAGAGADRVILVGAGVITITLGAGIDVIELGDLGSPIVGPYVITDFSTGPSGDRLDLVNWFTSEFTNWDQSNPFGASGHALLVQDGADTLLQVDYNGGANSFVTVLRFQNTLVGTFTSANTAGFNPSGAATQGLHLTGSNAVDVLDGTDGDDVIDGLGGDDILHGGAGDDLISGGAGNDRLDGGAGADVIYGGVGDDRIGANGAATIYGGDGDDSIAFAGASTPVGHATVYGEGGDDVIEARSTAPSFSITAYGGVGADHFTIAAVGAVIIDGGADDDVFVLETISGGTTLTLGDGADRVVLTATTSIAQPVVITDFEGGVGGDVVEMIDYLDAVLTTWNHQSNPFGAGLARLVEASGSTTLQLFYGSAWHDTLVFQGIGAAFLLQENLSGLPANGSTPHLIEIFGEQGPDRLIGGFGPEIFYGGLGQDYIEGGRGDDIIYGGEDGDDLRGGDGNDIIVAGGGLAYFSSGDVVIGGAGADTFVFQRGDGALTIGDFNVGVDHIEVYGFTSVEITHVGQHTYLNFGDNASAQITLPFFSSTLSMSDFIFHAPPIIPAGPSIASPGVTPGATIELSADFDINAGQTYYANAIVFDHDGSPRINVHNSGSIISITSGSTGASGVGGPSFTFVANINFVNEQSGVIRARADDGIARGLYVEDVVNHGVIEVVGQQAIGVQCNLGFLNSATGVVRVRGDINTFGVGAGLTFDNAGLIEAISPHRAIAVTAAAESWVNSGVIRAYSEELSIGVWGGNNFVNTGTIEADFAFYSPSDAGSAKTLNNSGYILGDIQFLNGADHIGNANEIVGNIFLAGGEDVVVNGGAISGDIYLGDGDDSYAGASGHLNGTIYAGYGDDMITLGSDGNYAFGEEGDDHIIGGGGDDVIDGGRGNDILEGGAGADTLSFASSNMGVIVDLSQANITAPTGVDTISGFENLAGSHHNDVLTGSAGDNAISGGAGNDIINGAGGADILTGGLGNDALTGGAGGDRYVFVSGDGEDVITDFDPAQDHIEVWGYAAYASLQQVGADVLVFLSPYNSILLRNTTVGSLGAGNFTFHASLPPAGAEPVPAAEPGADTIYLNGDDYLIAAGEQISFAGLRSAFVSLGDGLLEPLSTVTNDGSIHVNAHSTLVGVHANFINNLGAELIVELVGVSEGDPRIAFAIASNAAFYTAVNYGLIDVRSSADAEGVSELTLFENHGIFRVTAEGQARGVWAFDSATGFVNTGLFEIYGAGGGTTGYQIQVSGGVFNNSGVFRVSSAVSNSVAIDFGFNGVTQVFTNSGVIEAVYAIIGSGDGLTWGVADLRNTGEIYGIVDLGRGNDRIANDGLISGSISLGLGDDQYLGANGHHLIGGVFGGGGNDTIYTGVDDDLLDGGDGSDALSGGAGSDTFIGGMGNDAIDGGVGRDTSTYSTASTSATWTRDPSGAWTVTAGADGTDTLTGVEYLDFTDRDVFLDRAQSNFSTDGVSDFFLRNTNTGGVVMWFNASGSNAASLGTLSTNWINEGAGDFNGDGRDDIVWRDANTGNISMWFMNNQAVTGAAGLGLSSAWSISGIGDLNGDLKDDFVLRSNTGDLVLWFMDGGAVTGASLGNLSTAWQIEVLGDFNGDGRDDFIWRNSATGDMSMWLMNGTAVTPNNFANVGGNWNIVGVGDLNGDGRDDVIWRDQTTGNTALWFMNGGTITSQSGFNVATNYSIADVGDYNGDGRDDIIWRNSATNDVLAWYMNGATVQGSAFVGGLGTDWIINPGG